MISPIWRKQMHPNIAQMLTLGRRDMLNSITQFLIASVCHTPPIWGQSIFAQLQYGF